MNLRAHFLELQSLLTRHDSLWRPAPFHVARPQWCAQWPGLAAALDVLNDERVEELARMLGGVTITENTRAHAREMLMSGATQTDQ